jgi:hypothetical protein
MAEPEPKAAEPESRGQFPMSAADLWKRVATRGDLATVLVALPIGFIGDLLLLGAGVVSPGVGALLTASVALGIKNGIQSSFSPRAATTGPNGQRALPAPKALQELSRPVIERAEDMRDTLKALTVYGTGMDKTSADQARDQEVLALQANIDLFTKKLITEATF